MNFLEEKDKYWEDFYTNGTAPNNPSEFAKKCSNLIEKNSKILEIGCGNCRDSNYLSINNTVIAVDGNSQDKFTSSGVFFIKSSIENLMDIKCDYIYSRFFIHAVPEEVEDLFWNYIKRNTKNFLVEARSDKGAFDGDHYRRFINKESLENKLTKLGFKYNIEESQGLAVLGDDDPYVIRVLGSVE